MFVAACMTPEELQAWEEMAARVRNGGRRPCVDCPMRFRLEQSAVGRCNGGMDVLRSQGQERRRAEERRRRRRYESTQRYRAKLRAQVAEARQLRRAA